MLDELNTLHMYDSVLLSTQKKARVTTKLPSIKIAEHKGHRRNKTAVTVQQSFDESSSAQSQKNVLLFGSHEIETMKGHKISK